MKNPFIVAELSGNHRGQLSYALELVEAAANAGADAVKLQTFTPEQMTQPGVMLETGPWAGRELLDLYRETHTPRDWHQAIFSRAKALGMVAFSSVFHPDDVAFLETLECPIYKIASFELTDLTLIRVAAKTGKPIILSTGMASTWDIEKAVAACQANLAPTLLKCTSAYPAPVETANLALMQHMAQYFGCEVGLSDHTMGIACAVAATALGASVIEKHLTLSRADGGPDSAFSAEPDEFLAMVLNCRDAAQAIGAPIYGPTAAEAPSVPLRRSPGGKRGA